jgi:hypothetical protein
VKDKLDFTIIGAQKSGTTTLFELLKQHNDIYLPPGKEAFFFGRPEREKNGWDWYIKEFFSDAKEGQLWGTVVPHYMAYPGIAAKMHKVTPDIKIIAILRDPFSRSYSQYSMSLRRSMDNRNYYDAIKSLSAESELNYARNDISETNSYIIRSEYGRILLSFKEEFGLENMLVLFMDDLENSPQKVLDQICDFLEISDFYPTGIGKKFHKGSTKAKLVIVTKMMNSIKKNKYLKKIIKKIIPVKNRSRLILWINHWNVSNKKDADSAENMMIEEANDILRPIFIKDAELFRREFNVDFPWNEKLTQ